jgi:hypothetical protein
MMPKRREPVLMEGSTEFYPFCYLLIAADTALKSAKLELPGRNYHYVTAVVFSAFAVEATVNHVGLDHVQDWAKKERRMGGWEKKLSHLATRFGLVLDFNPAPGKTVKDAFGVRDNLAHGKTWVGEQCYVDDGDRMGGANFPDWLRPCLNEARATQFISDARELISQLLGKAGYPPTDLYSMGQGAYEEVIDPQAKPRPAVWKIKGTKMRKRGVPDKTNQKDRSRWFFG